MSKLLFGIDRRPWRHIRFASYNLTPTNPRGRITGTNNARMFELAKETA